MKENIPHLAVIPDGNRRGSQRRPMLLKRVGAFLRKCLRFCHERSDENHQYDKEKPANSCSVHAKGVERFRDICDAVFHGGVRYFTFWAASEGNLTKRSLEEVQGLFLLFRGEIEDALASKQYEDRRIRFRVVGRWEELLRQRGIAGVDAAAAAVRTLEERTRQFSEKNLTLLFGYDGRTEMREAFVKYRMDSGALGNPDLLDLRPHLATGFLPDVDLAIRTGETDKRWTHWSAGFLMWLCADAEVYSTPTFWPNFDTGELKKVLDGFGRRRRLKGA